MEFIKKTNELEIHFEEKVVKLRRHQDESNVFMNPNDVFTLDDFDL